MISGQPIAYQGVGTKVTIVPYTPIEGKGGVYPLGLSYSTDAGFNINPLGIAYRADTKEEAAADFAYAALRITVAISSPAMTLGRTTVSVLAGLLS